MKQFRIGILMDSGELHMLAEAARFHGVSRSQLIRRLVGADWCAIPEGERMARPVGEGRRLGLRKVA